MELQSNFFPIEFLSNKFYLRKFQYTDEKLKELRSQYNTNYSFFRVSDDIYCAKMTEEDFPIEDGIEVEFSLKSLQKREIDLNADDIETVQVISSLIKHTFFRTFKDEFKDKIRKPSSFYPFELLSSNVNDDLLRNFLPTELSNHIKFIKSIEIQLRKVKPHENTIFGFVVNYSYKCFFDRSCDELVNDNFDIIGLDVLILQEIMPDIILPDETLIGKISKVDKLNFTAVVETNLGEQTYPLKELFLRKDKTNIGKYLSEKLGANNAEIIFNQCKEAEMATYSGDKIYSEIKK